MALYWLTYKCNGRLAGVAIISARSVTTARTRAAVDGIGTGAMMFAEGHMLDSEFAGRVPPNCIGKMLSRREATEMLHRIERSAGNVR